MIKVPAAIAAQIQRRPREVSVRGIELKDRLVLPRRQAGRVGETLGALNRGDRNRRVIASDVVDGRRYDLHATKGWRIGRPA